MRMTSRHRESRSSDGTYFDLFPTVVASSVRTAPRQHVQEDPRRGYNAQTLTDRWIAGDATRRHTRRRTHAILASRYGKLALYCGNWQGCESSFGTHRSPAPTSPLWHPSVQAWRPHERHRSDLDVQLKLAEGNMAAKALSCAARSSARRAALASSSCSRRDSSSSARLRSDLSDSCRNCTDCVSASPTG